MTKAEEILLKRFLDAVNVRSLNLPTTVSSLATQWGITRNPAYNALLKMVERNWIKKDSDKSAFIIPHLIDLLQWYQTTPDNKVEVYGDFLGWTVCETGQSESKFHDTFADAAMVYISEHREVFYSYNINRGTNETTTKTGEVKTDIPQSEEGSS